MRTCKRHCTFSMAKCPATFIISAASDALLAGLSSSELQHFARDLL